MKILYFYQYFSTPKGAWGTRVYEFAKEWVDQGHEVIVISGIYSKSDLKASRKVETQVFDGITVKVINISIDNKQAVLKRVWTFFLYMLIACYYAIRIKADVVIASSGPISVGLPGLLSKLRSKKFVFEVRDLWPEGAITMGVLSNKCLIKFAYWFESFCYKKADHIITLSKGMEENIRDRFNLDYITSIPNGANFKIFDENIAPIDSFQDVMMAIYTGNIGAVNNSELLLEAATLLHNKKENGIHILLVGDGQQCSYIEGEIEKRGLSNISVMGLMPKIEVVRYLKASSVSLIPLEASRIWDTSSPNKLFESLACSKPVIQTTSGWIKSMLDETKSGFTVSPSKPGDLAELLINIRDDRALLEEMGHNARFLAKELFDKDKLSQQMLRVLEQV